MILTKRSAKESAFCVFPK